jgi:hypothetical protein
MPCRRFLSNTLAILAAGWVGFTSSAVRAQTVTIPATPIRSVQDHTDQAIAFSINRSDCLKNDEWKFTVNTANAIGLTLEVWAGVGGNDCTATAARTESTSNCTRVYAATVNATVQDVPVRTQDIALVQSGLYGTKNVGTVATCTPTAATSSAAQAITLYFMLFASGESTPKNTYTWPPQAMATITPLNLDLVGPLPPTDIDAQGASTFIKVSWTIRNDPDVQGYRFFCDPPPQGVPEGGIDAATISPGPDATCSTADASSSAPSDASSDAGDASSDGGSSTTTDAGVCVVATEAGTAVTCAGGTGSFFVPGGVPSLAVIDAFKCGSAVGGNTTTNGLIDGFAIGTSVAVAVASVDLVGNVGGFSTVSCAKTEAVNGFMDLYHAAGGTAGDGFCSMTSRPGGRHSKEFLYGSLVLGALFAIRIRRRSAPN